MQTEHEVKHKEYNVGVIVGRFQVPELHKMHRDLIQTVVDKHEKVFVFLGVKMTNTLTITDPLPFRARWEMITTEFPNVTVLPLKDRPNNEDWVSILDEQIECITTSFDKITLYGSRDSFLDTYKNFGGKYTATELISTERLSGTECRQDIARNTINSIDFRKGVVYAIMNM